MDSTQPRGSPLLAVAPNIYAKGLEPGRVQVEQAYEVVPLVDALERRYETDAHFVTYIVRGATRQPRINKAGLALVDGAVDVWALVADVDNPGHAPWTPEQLGNLERIHRDVEVLQTTGIYSTRAGWRAVQPLLVPIPVQEAERQLRRWADSMERAGINIDRSCLDWPRHFRLPFVRRDGERFVPAYYELERMRPIVLDPLPPEEREQDELLAKKPSRSKGRTVVVPDSWSSELPERWRPAAQRIAEAVRVEPGEWHALFMALSGALLSFGVPPEDVPAFAHFVSVATGGDTRTRDRVTSARTTVARAAKGLSYQGVSELQRRYPGVAHACWATLGVGPVARAYALAEQGTAIVPDELPQVEDGIRAAIESAPAGLTVIHVDCGTGKTKIANDVAADRANTPYRSPDAKGLRAPPGSKTVMSSDKHTLAKQNAAELRAKKVKALRLFGPASLKDDDGEPVCRYHEVAQYLVRGGQSVSYELCRGHDRTACEHLETCPAAKGEEGDHPARVILGPHQLLPQQLERVGEGDLVVVDEVASLLKTESLIAGDLSEAASQGLFYFDGGFMGALQPALVALRAFLETGEAERALPLADAIRAQASAVSEAELEQARRSSACPDGDIVECAQNAPFPPKHPRHAPPLRSTAYLRIRDPGWAAPAGQISRALGLVYGGLTSEHPVVVRIATAGGERQLRITMPEERLVRALRRSGPTVLLDANADLLMPFLERFLGYKPAYLRFRAPDGAPIERTLFQTSKATRKAWLKDGRLEASDALVECVEALFRWARQDPSTRRLAIVSMQVVEVALSFVAGNQPEQARADWEDLGQRQKDLTRLEARLAPIVRGWEGELLLAHYGATRGLNNMANADALVTLGDPWTNLADARNEAEYLGLPDWEARYEELCRAELEQAQGRLRTVHRQRPGRALHVGMVLPGGTGWSKDVRIVPLGRTSTVTPEQLTEAADAVGGIDSLAARLGCSVRVLRNYISGTRVMAPKESDRVLELLAQKVG